MNTSTPAAHVDWQKVDAMKKLLRVAVVVAAAPPMDKSEFAYHAKVAWKTIKELRDTLTALGVDWQTICEANHAPRNKRNQAGA